MILGIRSITTILFPLYVTHTRTRPIIIRLPEMLKRVGSEFTVVLAFEESLALPALSPRRPFSESWGGGRRGGRNEETLDANGERSNVAGKISSGGILAAGCFCIETWLFFFSFYLFLSLPPPPPRSTKTLGKIDTERCESSRERVKRRAFLTVARLCSPKFLPSPPHDRSFKSTRCARSAAPRWKADLFFFPLPQVFFETFPVGG